MPTTVVKKRRVSRRIASQGSTTTTSSSSSSSCLFEEESHNLPLKERPTSSSNAIKQSSSRRKISATKLRVLSDLRWGNMFRKGTLSHNKSLEQLTQVQEWEPITMIENTEHNYENGLTEAEKGANKSSNPPKMGYFTTLDNHDEILDTFNSIGNGSLRQCSPTCVWSMIRGDSSNYSKIDVGGTILREIIRAVQFIGSLADFKRLQALVVEGGPEKLQALVAQADAAFLANRGRNDGGVVSSYFVSEAAEDGSKVPESLMIKTECFMARSTSNKTSLKASLSNGGVGETANYIKLSEALFDKTNADGRKYLVWRKVFYIEQRPVEDYNGDDVLDTERLERICAAELEKARLAGAHYTVVNSWKLE